MNRLTRMLLGSALSLGLSGCAVSTSGGVRTVEVTWAKMGTPARIVDEHKIKVLVPDGNGGWTPGAGSLSGMIAIDEPTLEYYRDLDRQYGKEK